jgi:hypothetical protein
MASYNEKLPEDLHIEEEEDEEDRLIRQGQAYCAGLSPVARAAIDQRGDELFARMQDPDASAAVDHVFHADSSQLQAILDAAQDKKPGS